MDDANIILKQAAAYRKSAQYQKAVVLYHPLWNQDPGQFSEWDGWSYAYSLFKLKEYTGALGACRILYPRFKQFEMLRSLYARCIYYTQFKQAKLPPLPVLKKAAQGIYDLSDPKDPYSVTPKAIFDLCREMMAQPDTDWQEIENWLLKMQPDLLDDQAFKMSDPSGKEREIASAMEQWYAMMLRVKAGRNQPRELLALLAETRRRNFRWHYNNDIWFARKEAFAYQQLGQKEKAEKILRRLLLQKKDWFLLFDLAKVVPDKKEALQLLCRAALGKGKNEMKLKLYEAIYTELRNRPEEMPSAVLHLCLIAAIREENNWEVKPSLLEEIRSEGISINEQGSSSRILKQLAPFWERTAGSAERNNQKWEGTIERIFPHGGAGLIKAKEGVYYFTTKGIKGEIKPGQKVVFELTDSFDKKKNKSSKMAIKVSNHFISHELRSTQ